MSRGPRGRTTADADFGFSEKNLGGPLDFLPTDVIPTAALLTEGRLPETFGWRSRVRLPRAGLVTLHSGDPGLRLGDTLRSPRRESADQARASGPGKRGPGAKGSRGGAPRGAPAS